MCSSYLTFSIHPTLVGFQTRKDALLVVFPQTIHQLIVQILCVWLFPSSGGIEMVMYQFPEPYNMLRFAVVTVVVYQHAVTVAVL